MAHVMVVLVRPLPPMIVLSLPFKLNDPCRDKFPRARCRVANRFEYDRGLVQRGDVRFWIDESVLADWIAPYRGTPGGQRRYSNTAIEATLAPGAVFRPPLRQTEGFIRSLFTLMGVELPVPDHTTLARRRRTVAIDMHTSAHHRPTDIVLDGAGLKFYGPGEWDHEKHGERRRAWRKRNGYGLRSLGETNVGRIKRLNGGMLRARTFGARQKETAIRIETLNRMIRATKPMTERVLQPAPSQGPLTQKRGHAPTPFATDSR